MKRILNKTYYTFNDLAKALEITYPTLMRHFNEGLINIKTEKFGKRNLISEEIFNELTKNKGE